MKSRSKQIGCYSWREASVASGGLVPLRADRIQSEWSVSQGRGIVLNGALATWFRNHRNYGNRLRMRTPKCLLLIQNLPMTVLPLEVAVFQTSLCRQGRLKGENDEQRED